MSLEALRDAWNYVLMVHWFEDNGHHVGMSRDAFEELKEAIQALIGGEQ